MESDPSYFAAGVAALCHPFSNENYRRGKKKKMGDGKQILLFLEQILDDKEDILLALSQPSVKIR